MCDVGCGGGGLSVSNTCRSQVAGASTNTEPNSLQTDHRFTGGMRVGRSHNIVNLNYTLLTYWQHSTSAPCVLKAVHVYHV